MEKENNSVSTPAPAINNLGRSSSMSMVRRTVLVHTTAPLAGLAHSGQAGSNDRNGDFHEPLTPEQILLNKFAYFRKEFLQTASMSGLAVPLAIVEDVSEQIQPFLKSNGPKYTFELLQSQSENTNLLRSGLSLLVVMMRLLRKLFAKEIETNNERRKHQHHHHHHHNHHYHHGHEHELSFDETHWVQLAITKICDNITVASSVSLLIKVHNPVIQELLLNLVIFLVQSSDDATVQLFHGPNATFHRGEDSKDKTINNYLKKLTNRLLTSESTGTDRLGISTPGSEFSKTTKRSKPAVEVSQSNKVEDPNTCLSYIFSVAVFQKNRHLLMLACAEVVIAITQDASNQLCEVISRTPTCSLPLSSSINDTKNNSSRSKHSFSDPHQSSSAQAETNPLSRQIIDWAGVKIFLKFLFRYHQLKLSESGQGDGTPSQSTVMNMSHELRQEYLFVHNRVLLAICSLVGHSKEVLQYVLDLPGALELLQLSNDKYSESQSNDPNGIILNALNGLQMEKQHQNRIKAQNVPVRNARTLESPSPILRPGSRGNKAIKSEGFSPTMRAGTAPGPKRLGQVKKSSEPEKLPPLQSLHEYKKPKMSPSKVKQLDQEIQLSSTYSADFEASFVVETERSGLYKQNKAKQMDFDIIPSPLEHRAARKMSRHAKGPLRAEPSSDSLLLTSLDVIDREAKVPLLKKGQVDSPVVLEYFPSSTVESYGLLESTASPNDHHSRNSNNNSESIQNLNDEDTEPVNPLTRKLSATHDFFGRLSVVPNLPIRIEAKNVIHKGEDMKIIREKFRKIAENAIFQIADSGVTRNGKNTVSIDDRARKVYSPGKTTKAMRVSSAPGGDLLIPMKSASKAKTGYISLEPLHLDDTDQPLEQSEMTASQSFPDEDPDKTPAWNPRPELPSYYGIRLAQDDFEEQDLFENFKPIFEFNPSEGNENTVKSASTIKRPKFQGELDQTADLILP